MMNPEYRRIYNELRKAIEAGEYPIGTRLPPEPQLEKIYGVSRTTIRKAVSMEPDNADYLDALNAIETGARSYRSQADGYQTFRSGQSPCFSLCMCCLCQYICRLFCCW